MWPWMWGKVTETDANERVESKGNNQHAVWKIASRMSYEKTKPKWNEFAVFYSSFSQETFYAWYREGNRPSTKDQQAWIPNKQLTSVTLVNPGTPNSKKTTKKTKKLTNQKPNQKTNWAVQWSWFARVNALCNLLRKKSREVAASLPGRFLSRRCFTLCVTMEAEPRIAKRYKCHHCCSCNNYLGK